MNDEMFWGSIVGAMSSPSMGSGEQRSSQPCKGAKARRKKRKAQKLARRANR